ncbi:MAG TPA: VIT1/CCC1 transporter family protein [Rhodanobacteraceae bacterium]|nr:VIT1/CCC1 transporter family protein [Rhodanobacteraceae bacterium]
MTDSRVRRFLKNLRVERDNEALYAHLAAVASDARLARAYRRIAEGEKANAAFWEARLQDMGAKVPPPHPRMRVRVLGALAQWFGTGFVMPTVVRLEHADHLETPVDRTGHRDHFVPADARAARAHRHRAAGGNTLRASVLGANDGLVSNVSLVMGMAGAATGNHAVLLAGLAGLVAGACSMALGEWLSVNSSREFYQAQITERAERLAVAPEEGVRHIVGIYREKGLERGKAEHLARHLAETPRTALDTVVREDLGVDPSELGGSAWSAGMSSFCFFAFGAIFPVMPYFFVGGRTAMFTSMGSTFFGLCLIAVGTSLFTGRNLAFSIARQFAITAVAAAITFGVGHLLGSAILG